MLNKNLSRRAVVRLPAALALARIRGLAVSIPLRIGVTDWNLDLTADPNAVQKASELGFQGVQISFGRKIVDNKMPLDDPEVITKY
jgi:L-ribulose-5-phosphate 3-epimerase